MAATTMDFALRAAGDRGTFAQAWANGAAAGVTLGAGAAACLLVAVAEPATTSTAAAAPARSQIRLCIDSLRLVCAGSRSRTAAPALSHAPKGVPSRV